MYLCLNGIFIEIQETLNLFCFTAKFHNPHHEMQAIPEPIWPDRNENEENVPKIDKDLNYVADISFKKDEDSNDVLDVSRNGTFVRSIQFKNYNNNSINTNKGLSGTGSNMLMKHRIPRMLESQLTPIGEVENDSRFEDSIVTEALLQMTSFKNNNNNANVDTREGD